MKPKYVVLLMVGSILITAGAMAGGYFLSQAEEAEEEQTRTTTQSSQSSTSRLPVQAGSGGGQTLNPSTQAVNGATTPSGQQQSVPGPDEFASYEQYANETSALVSDLSQGTGEEAISGDTVTVVYQGWLTDGTLFDQSRTNAEGQIEAFSFSIGQGQVIRGWEEGIPGMRVGGKRRLVIPSEAGYGSSGQGSIPPDSMLIFDVELVQIQPREPGL